MTTRVLLLAVILARRPVAEAQTNYCTQIDNLTSRVQRLEAQESSLQTEIEKKQKALEAARQALAGAAGSPALQAVDAALQAARQKRADTSQRLEAARKQLAAAQDAAQAGSSPAALKADLDAKQRAHEQAKARAAPARTLVDRNSKVERAEEAYGELWNAVAEVVGPESVDALFKDPAQIEPGKGAFAGLPDSPLHVALQKVKKAEANAFAGGNEESTGLNAANRRLEALRAQLAKDLAAMKHNREVTLKAAREEAVQGLAAAERQALEDEPPRLAELNAARARQGSAASGRTSSPGGELQRKADAVAAQEQGLREAQAEVERLEANQVQPKAAVGDAAVVLAPLQAEIAALVRGRDELVPVLREARFDLAAAHERLAALEGELTPAGETLFQETRTAGATGDSRACLTRQAQAESEVLRALERAEGHTKCLKNAGREAALERWRQALFDRLALIRAHPCPGGSRKDEIALPDVSGRPIADVEAVLRGLGLQTYRGMRHRPDSVAKAGSVIAQSPAAGTLLRRGAEVTLDLYSELVAIPDVTGRPADQADSQLAGLGIFGDPVEGQPATRLEEVGRVYSQSLAPGTLALPGASVTLRYYAPPGKPDATDPVHGARLPKSGADAPNLEHGLSEAPPAAAVAEAGAPDAQTWIAVDQTVDGGSLVKIALASCDFARAVQFLEQVQPTSLRESLAAEVGARRQERGTLAAHLQTLAVAAGNASPAAIREAGTAAIAAANCPGDREALRAFVAQALDEVRAKVQSIREQMDRAVRGTQRAQADQDARWRRLGDLARGLARQVEAGAAPTAAGPTTRGASAGAAGSCQISQQNLSMCRSMESRDRNGVILHWVFESRSGTASTWAFLCQPRGAPPPSGAGLQGPFDTPDQALGRVPAHCR